MFEAKLSQDGTKITIFEDGEQREVSIKDFVSTFGTGILLERQKEPKEISLPVTQLILEYYASIADVTSKNKELESFMLEYRYAMPLFTSLRRKMRIALPDEIDGEEVHKAWAKYNTLCISYNTSVDLLNYMLGLVGFEPMPSNTSLYPDLDGEISKERFSRLLFERDGFRENLERLAEKYAHQGVVVSIYNLTNEALEMTW